MTPRDSENRDNNATETVANDLNMTNIRRTRPSFEVTEQKLASKIRRYWSERGYNVAVIVDASPIAGSMEYSIRSNLLGGLPRDRNSAVKLDVAMSMKLANSPQSRRYAAAPKAWVTEADQPVLDAGPVRVTVHGIKGDGE